jgi:hypothetical protein
MKLGNLIIASALAFVTPRTVFADQPSAAKEDTIDIVDDKCTDQADDCSVLPGDSWPRSNFRMGFTMMLEGNLIPFQVRAATDDPVWRVNLPIGFDFGGGGRYFRYGVILAPIALRFQSDRTHRFMAPSRLIGQGVYLTGSVSGFHVTIGSPEFDWSGDTSYKISKTTFGLGVVLARLPYWGKNMWFPEWRRN